MLVFASVLDFPQRSCDLGEVLRRISAVARALGADRPSEFMPARTSCYLGVREICCLPVEIELHRGTDRCSDTGDRGTRGQARASITPRRCSAAAAFATHGA